VQSVSKILFLFHCMNFYTFIIFPFQPSNATRVKSTKRVEHRTRGHVRIYANKQWSSSLSIVLKDVSVRMIPYYTMVNASNNQNVLVIWMVWCMNREPTLLKIVKHGKRAHPQWAKSPNKKQSKGVRFC